MHNTDESDNISDVGNLKDDDNSMHADSNDDAMMMNCLILMIINPMKG